MTQSEKNSSNSEISVLSTENNVQEFHPLINNMKYVFIRNTPYFSYTFKDTNAFNLITYNTNNPVSYTFSGSEYLLNREESILHVANPNDVVEFFLINVTTILIFIELPLDQMKLDKSSSQRLRSIPAEGLRHKMNPTTVSNLLDLSVNTKYSVLNKIKMDATILRWSIQQLELLLEDNEMEAITIVKNDIYEKIVLARSILDKDLSKNYSISELAKEVGTNEQYLKKYFKLYFHKTVQNYITEKKMLYAKNLILQRELRVADIARMIGYKHATHFTTAFKKYFGYIPNSLRFTFLLAGKSLHENWNILISSLDKAGI